MNHIITQMDKYYGTNLLQLVYFLFLRLLVCLNMVQFIVKLAYQIMFWFNQLMVSGLVFFQVVMMTQFGRPRACLAELFLVTFGLP